MEGQGNFGAGNPHWKAAISRNARQELNNPAYAYLVNEGHPYILRTSQLVQEKPNVALFSSKPFPPHDEMQDLRPFREAIPDIYHYKDMVEGRLKHGPIRIGGVLGIFGAKKYTTSEDIMKAAFPDAWLMLEGAPEGMRLIQHNTNGDKQYGKVEAIPKGVEISVGTAPVMSLKDYCEQDTAAINRRIAMLRATEQAKGGVETGGITPSNNEHGTITSPSVYRSPGDKPRG